MANYKTGDKVKVVVGDFHGAHGEVIDRKAFEELHGEFDLPEWAVFVKGKSGVVFWASPEELDKE